MIGGIRHYYVNVANGLGGALGVPKSAEYSWNGNTRQDFANGYILWNGSAIGYKSDGSLLFPPPSSGGKYNPYQPTPTLPSGISDVTSQPPSNSTPGLNPSMYIDYGRFDKTIKLYVPRDEK